jgi:hypothetical protein
LSILTWYCTEYVEKHIRPEKHKPLGNKAEAQARKYRVAAKAAIDDNLFKKLLLGSSSKTG